LQRGASVPWLMELLTLAGGAETFCLSSDTMPQGCESPPSIYNSTPQLKFFKACTCSFKIKWSRVFVQRLKSKRRSLCSLLQHLHSSVCCQKKETQWPENPIYVTHVAVSTEITIQIDISHWFWRIDLVGYNIVQSVWSKPNFRRSMSPPSSEWRISRSRKDRESMWEE
jgi:hypothetical protein